MLKNNNISKIYKFIVYMFRSTNEHMQHSTANGYIAIDQGLSPNINPTDHFTIRDRCRTVNMQVTYSNYIIQSYQHALEPRRIVLNKRGCSLSKGVLILINSVLKKCVLVSASTRQPPQTLLAELQRNLTLHVLDIAWFPEPSKAEHTVEHTVDPRNQNTDNDFKMHVGKSAHEQTVQNISVNNHQDACKKHSLKPLAEVVWV